jgi:hypothetical protein
LCRYQLTHPLNRPPCALRCLQSCGVDHVLSEEEVEEGEVDQLKRDLDKQAQEVGAGPTVGCCSSVVCGVWWVLARRWPASSHASSRSRHLITLPPSAHAARPALSFGSAPQEGLEDHWRQGAKGAAATRALRANFLEMWDKVVREAHAADVLFDQFLLDRLSSLLISLNT